jgi:hypothetical protein
MTNERKIGMHRLNPTHKVDDEVFMGFFPLTEDYYNDLLQDECFTLFLMSDGTTKEGQDRIADYYQVGELWEQMDKKECYYERYFQLLWLVKTKSPVDFLWVSFVEGLHRHAATTLALHAQNLTMRIKFNQVLFLSKTSRPPRFLISLILKSHQRNR